MPTYVVLVNWTDEGVETFKETVHRSEGVRQLAEQFGGYQDLLLWTQGRNDLIGVYDMPGDEAFAAFALQVGMRGVVRTESLRACTAEEMGDLIARLG